MALNAERQAWATGRPGLLQPGQSISPWFAAHQALTNGDPGRAQRIMVDDLQAPTGHSSTWLAPDAAPPWALEAITQVLPMPLPYGNPYAERVLVGVFNQLGEYDRAAHYGAAAFTRSPSAAVAIQVARSIAALGNVALARQWLYTAESTDSNGRASRRRDPGLPRARPRRLTGRAAGPTLGVREPRRSRKLWRS